jgi:hypothetical protein
MVLQIKDQDRTASLVSEKLAFIELTQTLLTLFQKKLRQRIFPNSFYEVIITLIPKPGKDTKGKENYRPISLINNDAKILNTTLLTELYPRTKWNFFPRKQGWLNMQNSTM